MAENAFLQKREFYKREINPVGQYVMQMTKALAIQNNVSEEEARAFIVKSIKNKAFPKMQDPVVEFFGRDHNLDRTKEELPLTHYIRDVVQNNQILAPTFTAYCSVEEEKSAQSTFIAVNVKTRSLAKKASQKAKNEGDLELAFNKNIEQANKKENNNSLSGLYATDSSVFENETGHNTLTSITRSMASIGNALNERMIAGNRHYRSKDIALNNIIAIISTMDVETTHKAMTDFGLHYPTALETLEVIKHSMRYYVFDKKVSEDLLAFVSRLSPLQRAAVVYNQDFFHLRKFNPDFVFKMLTDFATIDRNKVYEDPKSVIMNTDPLVVNYAHQVMIEEVKGLGLVAEGRMPAEVQQPLAAVCENIVNLVELYRPIINAFFLTKTVPNSTAYIQDMVRKDVVLSDTDSTMFAIDEWVSWYFGQLKFDQHAFGISGAVMFMSTQCIAHCLAILSANMGVAEENMFTLSMKPEFVFPVFVQSPVAKHYFTAKLVCEGSVYKDIEMEIKGVHNKNSALPVSIIEPAQERMEWIIREVMKGNKLSLNKEIKDAADIERTIINSLKNSEVEYLKRINIQDHTSYTRGPLESNYAFHTLWTEVFESKYGPIEPPPYVAIKVPTVLDTPSAFKKWLENMKDRQLAERLTNWAIKHKKKQLPTLYFNMDKVLASAIPDEIIEVIDYKKIVLDLTNVRRMLLDSLGFPCRADFLLTEMGY